MNFWEHPTACLIFNGWFSWNRIDGFSIRGVTPSFFVVPGKHNTHSFDLYSLGKDGKSMSNGNDVDDINIGSPDHPWLYGAYGFATREDADRRARIILLLPFLVLGLAIVGEIVLRKQ